MKKRVKENSQLPRLFLKRRLQRHSSNRVAKISRTGETVRKAVMVVQTSLCVNFAARTFDGRYIDGRLIWSFVDDYGITEQPRISRCFVWNPCNIGKFAKYRWTRNERRETRTILEVGTLKYFSVDVHAELSLMCVDFITKI